MWILKIGIFFCALSVIIGAFGAHSLENIIGDKMETFKTGVQYQMFHALALILIALISKTFNIEVNIIAYLFIAGIILFSWFTLCNIYLQIFVFGNNYSNWRISIYCRMGAFIFKI